MQHHQIGLFRLRSLPAVSRILVRLALVLTLAAASIPQAKAVTVFLDFVTSNTTDFAGVHTVQANILSEFGFTTLSAPQIQAALLAAVTNDFLGFPTIGADASSPLPNGKQLNIDFLIAGTFSSDPEFYYLDIGDETVANGFLGQACLSCVRTSVGGGPSASNGARVGSILTNEIDALAGLATTDQQRINLIAGTISHEFGHAVSLNHPNSALANPGASTFSLMATGDPLSTNMPNNERIKDRAFAYTELAQLMTALGTRDTATPEPATLVMMGAGLALLIGARKARGVSQRD